MEVLNELVVTDLSVDDQHVSTKMAFLLYPITPAPDLSEGSEACMVVKHLISTAKAHEPGVAAISLRLAVARLLHSLTLANGMGFSHTTWTTPPIHERSRMGLPRATLTLIYGKGKPHPEGGKRDLQGGGRVRFHGSAAPRSSLHTTTSLWDEVFSHHLEYTSYTRAQPDAAA